MANESMKQLTLLEQLDFIELIEDRVSVSHVEDDINECFDINYKEFYAGVREVLKRAAKRDLLNRLEWIPVSERMPEDGSWGIWTNGKWVSVERYKVDIEDHFWPSGKHFELEDATAWMPLPPLYKAKEVEDGK